MQHITLRSFEVIVTAAAVAVAAMTVAIPAAMAADKPPPSSTGISDKPFFELQRNICPVRGHP